ncbi:MAG: hypothetical protein O2954_00745 [bacterium]|nr:hypothetical protein [bacterium]
MKGKRPNPRTKQSHSSSTSPLERFQPFLSTTWAPIIFFALLSIVYFTGFVFTDNVMVGQDTGSEYHAGEEPFLQKVKDLEPANWTRYLGGTPMTGARMPQYFPLHIISLFTSHHRYLGWRYFFAMFSAGYFMYLCIRGFNLRPLTALFSGVAYASTPTLLTFIFAGQEAKMLVIALFPLMVWGLYRGLLTGRPIYFLLLSAGIGAGIYTPHLQMLYYGLWGLGILFLFQVLHLHRLEKNTAATLRRSLFSAGAVCLGLAIGAVGTFPQYWYTKTQSRRAVQPEGEGKGLEYAQSWALHPEEIASLIIPEFVHFFDPAQQENHYWGRNPLKLNSEYFGIIVLFFAALALARTRKDPRVQLLLALFLLSLAFSLGPHTPLHGLLYRFVPGMKVLRVPGMIAFLFAFPACVLAAIGLDRLLGEPDPSSQFQRNLAIGSGIAGGLLLLVALAPGAALSLWTGVFWSDIPSSKLQIAQANLPNLSRGALTAAALITLLYFLVRKRTQGSLSPALLVVLLLPLMLFDTWRIDKSFLVYTDPNRQPPPEQMYPDVFNFFNRNQDLYRVLFLSPLPVPIPGKDMGMRTYIDKVTVDHHEPFSVLRYDRIIQGETLQNLAILNLLNTKYIVSRQALQGLPEALSANGLYIYQNELALPWFYLAPQYTVETDEIRILQHLSNPEFPPTQTAILETEPPGFTPDPDPDLQTDRLELLSYKEREGHIELQVSSQGPRLLVISENYHPFWNVYVDGKIEPLLRANYVWKAVALRAGEHRVEFRFRDPIAVACRWISLLSTLGLIIGIVFFFPRSKENPNA